MSQILKDLFSKANVRDYPKGQIVLYEGDMVKKLHFLEEGYIKVYSLLGASKDERIIFIYGPDDIFPLTSYLTGAGTVRYFYECMSKVKMRIMDVSAFDKQIAGNITVGEELVKYSYNNNRQFIQRIDILSVNDARRKVVALLLFLVAKTGAQDSGKIDLPLTTQEIADMCAISRETASAQLHRLREENVLSGSKALTVDTAKLEKLKTKYSIPKFT